MLFKFKCFFLDEGADVILKKESEGLARDELESCDRLM